MALITSVCGQKVLREVLAIQQRLHGPTHPYALKTESRLQAVLDHPDVRAPAQHGPSSKKMALITSDCGIMCSLRIKWP